MILQEKRRKKINVLETAVAVLLGLFIKYARQLAVVAPLCIDLSSAHFTMM